MSAPPCAEGCCGAARPVPSAGVTEALTCSHQRVNVAFHARWALGDTHRKDFSSEQTSQALPSHVQVDATVQRGLFRLLASGIAATVGAPCSITQFYLRNSMSYHTIHLDINYKYASIAIM
jgi:hypothetical protein